MFLDELDKTGDDVRNALLLPFESGTYRNRKNNQPLDCTKTVWICATNVADPIIDDFFTQHLENKSATQQKEAPFYMLDRNLRAIFIAAMGVPFTGRISTIIPFFPFQPDEQAVIAHLEILKVVAKVWVPIDVKNKQLIGNINLSIGKDGEVCHHIADRGYERLLGARSVARHVEQHVALELADVWQDIPELVIDDINKESRAQYRVELTRPGRSEKGLVVVRLNKADIADKSGVNNDATKHGLQLNAGNTHGIGGTKRSPDAIIDCSSSSEDGFATPRVKKRKEGDK